MTKYVLAVSGGVDSSVLLDVFMKRLGGNVVVGHFDHGIRPDSADDARFVRALAQHYGVPFEMRREELGPGASEELARNRRYKYLFDLTRRYEAGLVTAHHRDDIIETIAINVYRGTGWRGLAGLNDDRIKRPLLGYSKRDIYQYAVSHQLEWVEDSTNHNQDYLRNKLRFRLQQTLGIEPTLQLMRLWSSQKDLKNLIDLESDRLLTGSGSYSRYFFTMIDLEVADELLRQVLLEKAGTSLTRPQRARGLIAIKTSPAGRTSQLGEGVCLRFDTTNFVVETASKVLK